MNKILKTFPILLMGLAFTTACTSDWNDHYDEGEILLEGVENTVVYNGNVTDYMKADAQLSKMNKLFEEQGVYKETQEGGQYTFIVVADTAYDETQISDAAVYAKYSVADMSVSPSKLVDGAGIETRLGKTVWVYDGGKKLDDRNIVKIVKTNNAYIYVLDGILPVRLSVYEYINSLSEDEGNTGFLLFKQMVKKYEYVYFDKENSEPIGVTDDGRVIYDSVKIVKNSYLDRYDKDGIATWNMRDESYSTTVFVPNNYQVRNAIDKACSNLEAWLHRKPTAADTTKFEQWIVRACFTDKMLSEAEVSPSAPDFQTISGCREIIDEVTDITEYKDVEAAWWSPSKQTVQTAKTERLSNGVAYYCRAFKIPNHIVIYRVKSRFFELWNNMTEDQQNEYFTWNNWVDPLVINDCQGQFDLAGGTQTEWPSIYYHNLCAIPSKQAMEEGAPCSVEYCGLSWVTDEWGDGKIYEVNLPKGEYFLRMGFKHSLLYSLSIGFDGGDKGKYTWLKKDMNMHATGSDYHFDRGAASEVPHYGDDYGIAYPEGYDVDYWQQYDAKAIAYDTDGYTVGVVNLERDGNFKIKIESSDMSTIYKNSLDSGEVLERNKNNVKQLMMYHWCLRPTHNNY